MKRRDVVVTGIGVICSGGEDSEAFAQTLAFGSTGLFPVDDPQISHYGPIYAGVIPDAVIEGLPLAGEDRFIRLADHALNEAIENAGIDCSTLGSRIGLFLGTCSGPMLTIEEKYKNNGMGVPDGVLPSIEKQQYYHAAHLLAGRYGIQGPVCTTTTACSAYTAALMTAADCIRIGQLDAALVGGADSFSLTTLAGFVGLKAVSSAPCAPFSLPVGLNLGEGAGFSVLEAYDCSAKRNAPVICTIEGYGLSNDAYHCSAPDPTGRGAARAMEGALNDAAISAEKIGYINAHGTGTEANDKAETKAVLRIFGKVDTQVPPINSTKSMIGHCLGAAGAIETIATLICAQKGVYPPARNFTKLRDGCALHYLSDNKRAWKNGGYWLKNNFAFGGNNASVVIKNSAPVNRGKKHIQYVDNDPIVISSAGILSSAGIASPDLPESYFKRRVSNHRMQPTRFGRWPVCTVPPFNNSDIDRRVSLRGMDRTGMLATSAALLALKAGRIPDRPKERAEIGFFMNLAQGSTWAEREHVERLLKNNFRIEQINTFPYIVPNAVTGTVSRALSLTGYNTTFCNGPGASLHGLVYSWTALKNRHAPAILCGSVDDCTEEGLYDCVAIGRNRGDNPVLGEGSVMLLLEPLSQAQKRGIEPLGKIVDCVFTTVDTGSTTSANRQITTTISEMFYRNGLNDALKNVCTVSCNDQYVIKQIAPLFPSLRLVDQTPYTGWMPACQPLFNTVAALVKGSIGKQRGANYILTILCSPYGKTIIVLFEKNIARKSEIAYDRSSTGSH